MRKFLLLSVCAASFLPSWAAADVTSVTTSSFIQLQGSVLDPANPGNEVGYFNFTDVPASSSGVHIGNGHLGDHHRRVVCQRRAERCRMRPMGAASDLE